MVVRPVLRVLLACALLGLASASVPAQETRVEPLSVDAFARPRRMIYFFETEPGSLAPFDAFLLYNSILTTVADANNSVVIVESPDLAVASTREGLEELARRVDADSWFRVYVAGGLDDLSVRGVLYDMVLQRDVDERVIRPGFPVTQRTLARGFWEPFAQAIGDEFEPIVDAGEVIISGVPDTTIEGVPGAPYTIGSDGVVRLMLPTPATYTIRASAPGYVPVSRALYLGGASETMDLVQLPVYRMAVDLLASSFQFPGARFRYHFVPARWFARVGLTTQYVGMNFVPNQRLFTVGASKLSTLSIDGGTVLGEIDEFTRYVVAAGVFVRLRHEPLGLESDASYGGFHASVGVELSPWRTEPVLRALRLFADYRPTFFITSDPDDFLQRSFQWNAFPGGSAPLIYPVGGWAVVDLRDLHLGVRIVF